MKLAHAIVHHNLAAGWEDRMPYSRLSDGSVEMQGIRAPNLVEAVATLLTRSNPLFLLKDEKGEMLNDKHGMPFVFINAELAASHAAYLQTQGTPCKITTL